MRIERFDPAADSAKVRACHEMYVACQAVDDLDMPAVSLPVFTGWVSRGWDANPREGWLAADDAGTGLGCYTLELPERENRHLARLSLLVPPSHRRRGVGTALLRHAATRAAGHGRTEITSETVETSTESGSAGSAFAAAVGASRGVTEIRRILDLASLSPGQLDRLRDQARDAAQGYSVVRWRGRCPEEYLAQVAVVVNAMADAPHNPGREPEQLDAERLREGEVVEVIQQTRGYAVAARCDQSGELVGLTRVAVDPLQPDWGWQQVTAVVRAHRGHRLGLLVKVAMMDWLAEAEPAVEHIVTGNAASNSHMIGINADLGYRVAGQWPTWGLDVARAAAIPASPVHAGA